MRKNEGVLGWYHSHPNYGPWLSGIDVNTQKNMQMIGPMLAIVIDPIRTQISGKVDIGAFRTVSTPLASSVDIGGIPEEKIKDFGTHYREYYKLDIEYFMSQEDYEIIEYSWTKFWKTILEGDQLIENQSSYRKTLTDLVSKARKLKTQLVGANLTSVTGKSADENEADQRIKELFKYSMEISQAVHQNCIKNIAFN